MKRIFLSIILFAQALPASAQTTPQEIVNDFYQGIVVKDPRIAQCTHDDVWGNCVTLAVIKVALATFGSVEGIFSSYAVDQAGTHVVFADGVALTVLPEEMAIADKYNKFEREPYSKYYAAAVIVYASICKRAWTRKAQYGSDGDCLDSFTAAVHYINSGYTTDNSGELLGLRLVPVEVATLGSLPAAIIRSRVHTAYCSYGIQDWGGTPYTITGGRMHNMWGKAPIRRAFVLSKT